jgi:uncharacterized protein (DUF1810 family)
VRESLDRFREAQDAPHAGFAVALRELQAGRKTSHWIWYVFPQLAGLGQSSTAAYYGLAGVEEAADYLRDRVLGDRLLTATAVVRTHLARTKARRARLEEVMGSHIDELEPVDGGDLSNNVIPPTSAIAPTTGEIGICLVVSVVTCKEPRSTAFSRVV